MAGRHPAAAREGAILPLLDDFVDMGVDILNPVQTSVAGLEDTHALKERFGGLADTWLCTVDVGDKDLQKQLDAGKNRATEQGKQI